MGKMSFSIPASFAECEVNLILQRTREGMAIARAKGKLRGRKLKLSRKQSKELKRLHGVEEHSISDLAETFSVSRLMVFRELARYAQEGER